MTPPCRRKGRRPCIHAARLLPNTGRVRRRTGGDCDITASSLVLVIPRYTRLDRDQNNPLRKRGGGCSTNGVTVQDRPRLISSVVKHARKEQTRDRRISQPSLASQLGRGALPLVSLSAPVDSASSLYRHCQQSTTRLTASTSAYS